MRGLSLSYGTMFPAVTDALFPEGLGKVRGEAELWITGEGESSGSILPKIMESVGSKGRVLEVGEGEAIPMHRLTRLLVNGKVVSFGVGCSAFRLNIVPEMNKVMEISGLKVIFSDPLSAISENVNLKARLWAALRKMYGL